HYLAGAGLVLLVVGTFRSVRYGEASLVAEPDTVPAPQPPPGAEPLDEAATASLAGRLRRRLPAFVVVVLASAAVDVVLRVLVSARARPDALTARIVQSLLNGQGF